MSVALVATGCWPRYHTPAIPPPDVAVLREMTQIARTPQSSVAMRLVVDTLREAVVVLAGPYILHPDGAASHAAHAGMDASPHTVSRLRFEWPVEGWVRGYQLDVFDSRGNALPASVVHHLVVTNFDRRQLIYPTAEKLVGIGRETGSVDLPTRFGVPLAPGQRMGVMAALHNESGAVVEFFLRLVLRWTPPDSPTRVTQVLPVNLDVNNVPGQSSAYDLPPGHSFRSVEFDMPLDGRLLAISGHLHDFGRAVRLEDAETSRVVAAVRGRLDRRGKLVRVEQKTWIGFLGRGIRVEEGRRYRLVGEYDNPHADTLRQGAMAQMIAVFAPDEQRDWPRVDTTHHDYKVDVAVWQLQHSADEFTRNGSGSLMPYNP